VTSKRVLRIDAILDRIMLDYGPALEALGDWSYSGCPCAQCWLERELRRIEEEE